jgi:hypothetical protein
LTARVRIFVATVALLGAVGILAGDGEAQERRESRPILELESSITSTMPGSMFIPFRFWVPAGRIALTHRRGGWDYYCASLEEAGASFPGLGSVVADGDCVGVRRRQSDAKLEWVVDNSFHNGMTTIWSRPVTRSEAAELHFVVPAPVAPVVTASPPPSPLSLTTPPPGPGAWEASGSPVAIYEALNPSIFMVLAVGSKSSAQGSAVAISQDLAITNCHVIDGHPLVGLSIGDDVEPVTRAGVNVAADLCLLRSAAVLTPVKARRAFSDLKVGERVFAIGSPRGLQNTISDGIISGLRIEGGVRYIQTSAAISPGSSGGALVDAQGRVVGITTFRVRDGESLNFAVSIDEMPIAK